MADLAKLVVKLEAESSKLRSEVERSNRKIGNFAKRTKKSSNLVKKSFDGITRSARDMRTAIASIGVGRAAIGLLNTNREMESLRIQLVSITGSANRANKAFSGLQDFAETTPFQLQQLTKTFIRLKAFGLEPTGKVMQAITDQSSKLGASGETLNGITLALGQAWAKGKLQGEEILQLVERGVPVYDLLAKSTGKNSKELQEMQVKGLLTRDVIKQLISTMGELSQGANARAMDTLNGKISNLSDSWVRFQDTLLNDKSEGFIKGIVGNWIRWIDFFEERLARGSGEFGAIEDINDRIIKQKEKISAINSNGVIGGFIDDIAGNDINLEKNRLDALIKQRGRIIKDISDRRRKEFNAEPVIKIKPKSTDSSLSTTHSNKKADPGRAVIDNLNRQIALFDQASNVAKFRYELELGSLKGIDEAQKRVIRNYAVQLDALGYAKDEQAEFDEIIQAGIDLAFEQSKAMQDAALKAKNNADELSVFADQAARNMQSSFADFLFDPFDKGLDGMLVGFAKMLQRMAAEAAAAEAFNLFKSKDSGGSGFGGIIIDAVFGAATTVKHEGGMVGSGGGRQRNVNPAIFASAPRFHNGGFPGLKANEVPIIAERGEQVLSKQQVANGQRGSGVEITTNVNVSGDGDQNKGRQLAKMVDTAVTRIITKEKRPGGLLA